MANLQNLTGWHTNFPARENVQPNVNENSSLSGGYLSGESAVIVAGNPKYAPGTGLEQLVPIGLVQQAQISQNKQLNQIYEIGGRIPYFVPARVNINASLSRVLFDGPSLFYALYRTGGVAGEAAKVPEYDSFGGVANAKDYDLPTAPYTNTQGVIDQDAGVDAEPGYFWTNLASSIFNKPVGLGFILYDMQGDPYGGIYLEECFIRSHSFGISANQTVLAENVSLVATKIKPLSTKSMPNTLRAAQ